MWLRTPSLSIVVLLWHLGMVPGGRAESPVAIRAGAALVDVTPREFPISMLGSLGENL
ncbi:MAG TPA: hypothetical protein PK640_20680 [Verrucomicrobiota bacterium]|nr:hypothetical protein [Verrucomicrobiota bacterium]